MLPPRAGRDPGAASRTGLTGISDLGPVHAHLAALAGGGAALAFGVALMASGLSSSSVGTYASRGPFQRGWPAFPRRYRAVPGSRHPSDFHVMPPLFLFPGTVLFVPVLGCPLSAAAPS
jgi:hypothetical protein